MNEGEGEGYEGESSYRDYDFVPAKGLFRRMWVSRATTIMISSRPRNSSEIEIYREHKGTRLHSAGKLEVTLL